MVAIDVDFEVFKELTYRRDSEVVTENEVIRKLLGLKPTAPKARQNEGKPWVAEGVVFPDGTEFRGARKGKVGYASVVNGELRYEGKKVEGLSPAAKLLLGYNQNGWTFWEVKRPGDPSFILADRLRKK